MAYTPDSELDREYLTTDTTQTITGNKTFDGSSTFNSSLVVNPTSPFYVKNNKIRFYTSGTEYGWIGTNGATDVRIDVSNGGELLTNYTPVSADGITNKSYVDNSISSAVVGSAVYKGAWNASTNTPDLTSVAKAQGDFYIVSVAGTTSIDGVNEWSVGDWILFNGTAWEKVDNSQTIPVNIGTGAQVFKSLNAVSNQADFRTLVGGSIISLTQNADDITIDDSDVVSLSGTQTITGAKTFDNDVDINGVVNLASTTNGSSVSGDIWYDNSNVQIEESLRLNSNGTALSLVGTNHTYMGFYPTGYSNPRGGYVGYGNPGSLDLYLANESSGKDLFLRTSGGKVDVDDTIRFSGTLTDNGTSTAGKHMLVRDDATGDVQLASYTAVKTKTITLESPTTSDTEIPIWYTDEALTVAEIFYECIGGTSTTLNIQKKANLGDAGTNVNTSAITAGTTKGSTTALSGASVPVDNYLVLNVTAVSGSVNYVSVTIKYTVV